MVPPQNPNDFDFTFWSRSRQPDQSIPAYIRETREHQANALRHELSKALAVKPLSCRDSDGTYRGTKGEPLDPAALYHIGVPLPPPVQVEPGEPDWSLHVDPRRPLIGELHKLFADDWGGSRYYLQIFRYTAAGRIPDGLPQCIYDGRIQGGHSIYACDHLPPPPFDGTPRFYRLNEGYQNSQLLHFNLHPDQYAHLDPALVAQVLPHPHERFLPGNRVYPEPAPDDAPASDNSWNAPEKHVKPALNTLTPTTSSRASLANTAPDTDNAKHQLQIDNKAQSPHRNNTKATPRAPLTPTGPSTSEKSTKPALNALTSAPAKQRTTARAPAPEKPPKPFSEDQKRMLHLLEIGFTIAEATNRMSCSRSCFNNWTARNPAFKQAAIDARDRYCEDIASDMDQLHNTVRERLELWIHAKDTPENLRFRAVSLFLRYAHTPHLLPRRLQALMPHSLHAEADANTDDRQPNTDLPGDANISNQAPLPTQAKPDQSTTTSDQKAPSPTPDRQVPIDPGGSSPETAEQVSPISTDANTGASQIATTDVPDAVPASARPMPPRDEQQGQHLPLSTSEHSESEPSPITDYIDPIDLPSTNSPNTISIPTAPRTKTPATPRTFPYSYPLPQPPDGRIFQP